MLDFVLEREEVHCMENNKLMDVKHLEMKKKFNLISWCGLLPTFDQDRSPSHPSTAYNKKIV